MTSTTLNFGPIVVSVVLALCVSQYAVTYAQYMNEGYGMTPNNHYAMGGEAYGGGSGDDGANGVDDRPKVQLGIRLKIPAFRFELPRFNMPKITVSAKIRQPNRPRTITLPEINLDTSSKVAAPGSQEADGMNGGGYYGGQQQSGNYGGYSSDQRPSYMHGGNGNERKYWC